MGSRDGSSGSFSSDEGVSGSIGEPPAEPSAEPAAEFPAEFLAELEWYEA